MLHQRLTGKEQKTKERQITQKTDKKFEGKTN